MLETKPHLLPGRAVIGHLVRVMDTVIAELWDSFAT